jgi:hypothetical protein
MTGSAASPDDASHRRENLEVTIAPFILRDAARRPLLRMREIADLRIK